MSNSRLEKFIYAICSMDVSDLPVPLSRIEKLWNCLITGETPDFEPLSRNEKYLMAMLDRYDISNLPAPMSRGEKLLYKIAVGETDLSDVPGYLSRYEELLKYLIENGGIGFEYVLHTLNQSLSTLYTTAEKPVKSAILKGQTLVNLFPNLLTGEFEKNTTTKDGDSLIFSKGSALELGVDKIKTSTTYTFILDIKENTLVGNGNLFQVVHNETSISSTPVVLTNEVGLVKSKITTLNNLAGKKIRLYVRDNATSGEIKIKSIMLLEGDYTNVDIPYFEGMQSVKMPVLTTIGKNLIKDISYEQGSINGTTGQLANATTRARTVEFIKLRKNITYTISVFSEQENVQFREFLFYSNANLDTFKNGGVGTFRKTFTYTPEEDEFCRIVFINNTSPEGVVDINSIQLQLEQGSTATSYEPFKSNILSTSEDVTLRGIRDVKDELNCLTGELIIRTGEVMFSSSDGFQYLSNQDDGNFSSFAFIKNVNRKPGYSGEICDRLKRITNYSVNENGIYYYNNNGRLELRLDTTNFISRDLNGLNDYLSKNPITVQYQLETESVKTVDLTTVDQDGQPTKLKTFNDITHVEIDATNIIPSVDLEVATKINEALSTMGPQQLDISNTQNKLGQTIDEQTENTDATMMATTEIYEQTL